MQNKLGDLNNHLFAQLERLNDEDNTPEQLQLEIQRSKAVSEIATQIINNGSLVLKAAKYNDDRIDLNNKAPQMLEG